MGGHLLSAASGREGRKPVCKSSSKRFGAGGFAASGEAISLQTRSIRLYGAGQRQVCNFSGRSGVARLTTIFGGSGFIGRYLVQELAKSGSRIRIATRDPHLAAHVKPLAVLGQLELVRADLRLPASVARAADGADAVVNLVGVLDDRDHGFAAIHVAGAGAVAEAARTAGARAFVHVSAIGADADSASAYGRSKGEGEAAVRAAFPGATILRPSIVFGPEDQFLNRFAGLMRLAPVMPVVAGGTRFQPVYVADVARAIAAALADPASHGGKTYALGGPEAISMRALLAWIAAETGRSPSFIEVPDGLAAALARLVGWLPGAPLTHDQWLMLQADNVVAGQADGLAAMGIEPTPMRAVAPQWLVRFRRRGRFS
jgi:NADH dehydrogenase